MAFRATLAGLGLSVQDFRTFPDHHPYPRMDREDLDAWARRLAPEAVVVTTQKDLVKLGGARLGGRELWAVRIQLTFAAGQEVLDRKLREVIRLSL